MAVRVHAIEKKLSYNGMGRPVKVVFAVIWCISVIFCCCGNSNGPFWWSLEEHLVFKNNVVALQLENRNGAFIKHNQGTNFKCIEM